MIIRRRPLHAHSGFSLLEVLIAMLILAIGLLGMAGLVLQSMKSNQSSYQRTQASLLSYDMAERIRLNPAVARDTTSYVLTSTATPGTNPACTAGCSKTDTAQRDVFEWSTAVAAQGLSGTVSKANTTEYLITVSWDVSLSNADSGCGSTTCSFQLRVNL